MIFKKYIIFVRNDHCGYSSQASKDLAMPLIISSADIGSRKVTFRNITLLSWLTGTLRATLRQFDAFTISWASGTYCTTVTPILLSVHVLLTVTPCNTLPHQHTITTLFFRKPTPLGSMYGAALWRHESLVSGCSGYKLFVTLWPAKSWRRRLCASLSYSDISLEWRTKQKTVQFW